MYLSASWARHIEFVFAALELRGAEVRHEHERELSPARVLPPDLVVGTQGQTSLERPLSRTLQNRGGEAGKIECALAALAELVLRLKLQADAVWRPASSRQARP